MKKFLLVLIATLTLASCSQDKGLTSANYTLQNAPNGAEINLGFDTTENSYFGSVVNRFFGKYELNGNKIKFYPAGATMMMGPQDAMDAEQEFFTVLPQFATYKIKDNTLTLTTDNGQEFVFIAN